MSSIELPETSGPAARALEAAGIRSLQDLSRRTEASVAALHGMGPKGIRQLAAALAEHGLSFAAAEADAEGHPS